MLTGHTAEKGPSAEKTSEPVRYAMVVDLRKCTGCQTCAIACKMENSVPLGVWRIWVNEQEKGDYPHVTKGFVPLLCNNCENPHCVTVCPVKATYKRDDGIVEINPHLCVGCKICMLACPYQMRYLHPYKKMADKCDWCAHRVESGLAPACAAACPTEALIFGNLRDEQGKLAQLISSHHPQVLKPGMKTDPQVYYICGDRDLPEIRGTPYR